jgi:hypothetical protein
VDRLKDIVIRGGENISCTEVFLRHFLANLGDPPIVCSGCDTQVWPESHTV